MEDIHKESMSIRKRRNLSKNKGQTARQREKTPEPSRTPIPHEDTTTSDDEDHSPPKSSREIEADNTYEEMKRLVQEKANLKDPVYDLDRDEVLEARALAANERRRRSISPFAIPDKEEDTTGLERKGSFIDPTNKLLTTNYTLGPKGEDLNRRGSMSVEISRIPEKSSSLSPPTTANASPKDKNFPYSIPTTPKKLDEMVYPDEIIETQSRENKHETKPSVNTDEFKVSEEKQTQTQISKKSKVSKASESPSSSGELVTRIMQVERTPSRKLTQDQKPTVEIRERIVRTPSRKMTADMKPASLKQSISNLTKEEQKPKIPPVKPARSKSATRFGNKTSESDMSEDQQTQLKNNDNIAKRKVVPTPRRFLKNKSPRVHRSQSFNRTLETVQTLDKTGTGISQTSKEILELMQKARARSLSIPKNDVGLPTEYKQYSSKVLQTPNKTPTNLRHTRGISCPKTIQIISDREILSGLSRQKSNLEQGKRSRHSSGYVEASQSEYTSSCYSSSPSENEYEFDLSERTAELTRKLYLLSEEVNKKEYNKSSSISCDRQHFDENKENVNDNIIEETSVLRKRSIHDLKNEPKEKNKDTHSTSDRKNDVDINKEHKIIQSKWKLLAHWKQFREEQKNAYDKIRSLRNRCVCEILLLIIICGLGGILFKTLEGSFENAYKCGSRGVKRDFIESLWLGSHSLREEDWKSMARKKLFEFENQLHTAFEAGITSYSGQRSWNFMNSFVYCLTLVTTIGYGHIAPKTTYGRVATIIYAIIGIPLFLIVLADFGKLFTRIIKFFWAFIRRFYYTRSCRKVRRTVPVQEVIKGLNIVYDVVRRPSQIFNEEDIDETPDDERPPPIERKSSELPPPLPPKPGTLKPDIEIATDPDTPAPSVFEIDDEFNLPISVAITILIVYIIIGAFAFNIWEKWNFFESFYFVFISMSTIGLGDLVPDHPMFMMASILYLIFGLALTSMCINVVQVKLSDTFKQASAKLGATIGLKVAEEDGSLVPITPPPVEIAPIHNSTLMKSKPEAIVTENKLNNETNEIDCKNR